MRLLLSFFALCSSVLLSAQCTLTVATVMTKPSCFGLSDGKIMLNLSGSGSSGTLTYAWSNGATTKDIMGLVAGPYSVTVTSSSGCSATKTATLSQPTALNASFTATKGDCKGNALGTLKVTGSGGTGTKTYVWDNASTSNLITGLAAQHVVTITDANGCKAVRGSAIEEPDGILVLVSATPEKCLGTASGTAWVTSVSGGTGAKTLSWSNGSTTASATNLQNGAYFVTATDTKGCTSTGSAQVTSAVPMVVVPTVAPALGGGQFVTFAVTGGTAFQNANPFRFSLGTSTTYARNWFHLPLPTSYTYIVKDAYGCTKTGTINGFAAGDSENRVEAPLSEFSEDLEDDAPVSSELEVSVLDRFIQVNNLDISEFSVYDFSGKLVKRSYFGGVEVPSSGIFVVSVLFSNGDMKSQKVFVAQ